MVRYAYERLSEEDNVFLLAERPTTPMHVSAIQIFEAGPLGTPDGGIDIAAIRDAYRRVLHEVPRYRQKLAWIPLTGRAVWIDDPHFDLDYHVRHVALPRPGKLADLKRVAGRVVAHALDRHHPLWELWVVEGMEDGRFAMIAKTHHCMIDGASGVQLAQKLLAMTPETRLPEPPVHVPQPAPSDAELLRDEVLHRMTLPLRMARGIQQMQAEVGDLGAELRTRARAAADLLGLAFSRASETPLNGPLSPHRGFDWCEMPLAELKAVRRKLDCTVNDVVLATVTNALRQFLRGRGVRPDETRFRVSTPVSVRSASDRERPGNRVSSWIVELPIDEPDPLRQVERVREETRALKEGRQADSIDMLMSAAELAPSGFLSLGARLASGPINAVVTNVPGPQLPLYLLGARMEAIVPQVPLIEGIGLGIALISYDGRVFWGFTGDAELVPDLAALVEYIDASFTALASAAGVERHATSPTPASPARAVNAGA